MWLRNFKFVGLQTSHAVGGVTLPWRRWALSVGAGKVFAAQKQVHITIGNGTVATCHRHTQRLPARAFLRLRLPSRPGPLAGIQQATLKLHVVRSASLLKLKQIDVVLVLLKSHCKPSRFFNTL